MALPPERVKLRELFMEICNQSDEWKLLDKTTQETLIRRMERSCFNDTIMNCIKNGVDRLFTEPRFIQRYSATCSRVLSNMNSGTVTLLDKIINGDINANNVATLSAVDLCPEASEVERSSIQLRLGQKIEDKFSSIYTCPKCKCKKTKVREYQSRSADECGTFSIWCSECEYVWRH